MVNGAPRRLRIDQEVDGLNWLKARRQSVFSTPYYPPDGPKPDMPSGLLVSREYCIYPRTRMHLQSIDIRISEPQIRPF